MRNLICFIWDGQAAEFSTSHPCPDMTIAATIHNNELARQVYTLWLVTIPHETVQYPASIIRFHVPNGVTVTAKKWPYCSKSASHAEGAIRQEQANTVRDTEKNSRFIGRTLGGTRNSFACSSSSKSIIIQQNSLYRRRLVHSVGQAGSAKFGLNPSRI